MYGQLELILGPMFSSKTTSLIERVREFEKENKQVLIIKPQVDNRYSLTNIVSHDGLTIFAISVGEVWPDLKNIDVVAIDEIQFFDENIIVWIQTALRKGITVIASGLDMDWTGSPFVVSALAAAIADRVDKRTAICSCGNRASKSFKKTHTGPQVELGSQDLYEPRCNSCWN